MTQYQAAKFFGITQSTFSGWAQPDNRKQKLWKLIENISEKEAEEIIKRNQKKS